MRKVVSELIFFMCDKYMSWLNHYKKIKLK